MKNSVILTQKQISQPKLGDSWGLVVDGSDDEREVIILIWQEVLLTRPGSPRVHASQSHLALLDMHLGERTFYKVA